MARKYYIYRLEAPSGRAYVGLTGQGVHERWRQHKMRMEAVGRHPLYDSMRKYGPDNFTVSTIACASGLENAKHLEVFFIAAEKRPYNILPGGEHDGGHAAKIFWSRIKADEAKYAEYRAKLVAAQAVRKAKGETREHLRELSKKWRVDNAKQAYKNSRRALRLAKRKNITNGVREAERQRWAAEPLKERLLRKYKGKHAGKSRSLFSVWARRTEAERAQLSGKIAESMKKYHAANKGVNAAQLAEARKNIDRSKQGTAASEGIKRYWQNLKADPVKYAEVMESKKRKLREKYASKNI